MDNSLQSGYASDMSMEKIEGGELPARKPDENVIPPTEHPH
jgi:hypothetical protein